MIYIPSIPDNTIQWKVFEDDQYIKRFIEVVDDFSNVSIDQEQDQAENSSSQQEEEENPYMKLKGKTSKHKIVQLKNNFTPKCLVPL